MSQSPSWEQILETHLQTLAFTPATLHRQLLPIPGPRFRALSPRPLSVRRLSQLRRDFHLLGWFRWLCEQQPPLSNQTRIDYLVRLRRLLDDLAANGHPLQKDLIRREDFPPRPHYLPKPLPPPDDQLLQLGLRRTDDLPANALLLTRVTGIRIGECIHLSSDCLAQLAADQWALHVPLGKLHTERLVPADDEVRRIVARLLTLRTLAPPAHLAQSEGSLALRGLSPSIRVSLRLSRRG